RCLVRIFGHLGDRLAAPTVARPTFGHEGPPLRLSPGTGEIFQFRDLIHEGRRRKPDAIARSKPAAQIERARYSAAARRWLRGVSRRGTSSSAAVGCTAMTVSMSAFVAFIFSATATSWIISPASGPTMWQPTS